MKRVQNLIIGAGPAGLATAGRCRKAGIPFEIIEASDVVGVAWHNHYDRLHLHTVKQWSHLPHLPFPDSYPTYVSRQQLVDYFEMYVKQFEIHPVFNTEVQKIERADSEWSVRTSGALYHAENVVIATGVNRLPKSPSWSAMDTFEGQVVHSKYYKNAEPYLGKNVLVVGMGNTGAELALDLSEHDINTYISVRSPISVVPRDLNGRPVQVTSKMLEKIPFGLGDWLGSQIRKVYFGDVTRYGLRIAQLHPAQQLRETGKTPVVDIGTIDAIKAGKITVKPDVQSISEKQVTFVDQTYEHIDQIILATGYRAGIEEILPAIKDHMDDNGLPRGPIGEGALRGLYFVGYDNYKLGGIIGTIYTDSETVTNHLKKLTVESVANSKN